MIPISTAQSNVLASKKYTPAVRVSVQDSGGTYRLLTTLLGWDFVESVSYGQSIDDPHMTLEVELKREVFQASLAPLVQGSAFNRSTWLNPSASYSPLLDGARKIKLEAAIVPFGETPQAADWFMAFEGYIDEVDAGDGTNIHVTARDLGAKMADTFIENERTYGLVNASSGPFMWSPATAYNLNDLVLPTNLNGFYYKCTTAGTTGSTEPVWPSSGTVADGSVVWTEQGTETWPGPGVAVETIMQAIIADNGLADTLSTPVSPGWFVHCFNQQRQSVLEGVRALAQQIGWDVRYLFSSGAGVLTFYQPTRSSPPSVYTFPTGQVTKVSQCKFDLSSVRNAVRVCFNDSQNLRPDGTPTPSAVVVTDSASITKYGRRFMEISEGASSRIDTLTEATTLANACLNDLSEPLVDLEIETLYFPFAELNDYYTFKADSLRYDTDQSLAVVKIQHTFRKDQQRTTLSCRGKPCGFNQGWHDNGVQPGPYGPKAQQLRGGFDGPITLTITPTPAGLLLNPTFAQQSQASQWEAFEYHISTTANFTPSSSTLVAVQKEAYVHHGLDPTKTYYATIVPLRRRTWL